MDPCGTAHVRSPGLENSSPTFTLNIILAKCDSYHFIGSSEKVLHFYGVKFHDQ